MPEPIRPILIAVEQRWAYNDPSRSISLMEDGTITAVMRDYSHPFGEVDPVTSSMRDEILDSTRSANISATELGQIIEAFLGADFFNRNFSFNPYVLDAGSYRLTFRYGGKERAVEINGTANEPDFIRLFDQVKDLARNAGVYPLY